MEEDFSNRSSYVHRLIRGPLVNNQKMALELAMIGLRYEYENDCGSVKELVAHDKGDVWEVVGTGMHIQDISGQAKVLIRKFDGAFLNITIEIPLSSG